LVKIVANTWPIEPAIRCAIIEGLLNRYLSSLLCCSVVVVVVYIGLTAKNAFLNEVIRELAIMEIIGFVRVSFLTGCHSNYPSWTL